MSYTKIAVTYRERIAIIALDSPKNLNAFDEIMLDELVDALTIADKDQEIKVIVMTSTSKAFSAGGDIGAMLAGIRANNLDFSSSIKKMASVSLTMKKISKPVICSVAGAVAGAGFNVALAADLIVAADNAMFIQAFVNIGLIPDAGGLYLLSRAVGVNKAMELSMLGRPIHAAEAKQLGFVTSVVAQQELTEATVKLAKQLASGPATAYAELKRLMLLSEFSGLDAYVQEEVNAQIHCKETSDFVEGITAFSEKRKANFK